MIKLILKFKYWFTWNIPGDLNQHLFHFITIILIPSTISLSNLSYQRLLKKQQYY